MGIELKVENDEFGKKVSLPGKENGSYSAYAFDESPQGVVSLTANVDGRKLISHYQKEDDLWKIRNSVRSGPLVIGHPTYEQGTPEYEAFEMLNKWENQKN